MVEEKLVHPIVTARTLPRGDRRETNTHTHAEKNKSKFISLFFHSCILLFEYRCIYFCVSHSFKNARLDFFFFFFFFFYSEAVFTVQGGC